MIKAVLMVGDRLVGIFEAVEPQARLRFCVSMMAEPLSVTTNENITATFSSSSTIFNQIIIFSLHRRIGYDTYEYQYEHVETNEKFRITIQESFEFLRESNEKINLDKLKQKFRSREKMTELLLKYYRS